MEVDLVCGICHDDSLIDIGEIDCCDHRFCYPCIAKWSEIESKCPFCKLRFKTLSRIHLDTPLTSACAAQGRLVGKVVSKTHVPEKDQRVVFEDPQFLEWLEGLTCIICNGSDQEDQLLLCDGCDQACHTFCLGLSRVPEDAWFCSQCEAARNTPARDIHDTPVSPYSGNGRRLRRRISRSRPFAIIDSDEESLALEDSDDCSSLEEILETVERPTHSRRLRRRRDSNLSRRTSVRGNIVNDGIGSASQGEYVDLVSPDGTLNGQRAIFDLQSPEVKSPSKGKSFESKDKFSPPLLDLRSRLRLQLLNHEREHVGILKDSSEIMTPRSSTISFSRTRALPSSWRSGRVTTLGDLSFGASVAAGRVTPKSYGSSTQELSPPSGRLFAHKTQAMVHAAMAGSSDKTKQRVNGSIVESRKIETPSLDSFRMVSPDIAGPSKSGKKGSKQCPREPSPLKKARELVREQLSVTFKSVSLPRQMESFIREHAIKALLDSCPNDLNADHASSMVDQALKAYNEQI